MGLPSEIPPDTLLAGKLRLIQRIGRGGMGDVWLARNEATQAEVAVKTLVRSERNAVHDERFRREARLAATISHRNVVRIFDLVDAADGTLGLVMELLKGGTLEACMRERPILSTSHALAVATPILSALHHVHEKGIVHRDVKPANIFFAVEPDGHVIPKILDFGIAKLPAAGSALTMDGSVLGTPHYMSPEQIRGQLDLGGRSDMFSLAVVLYEMLTGVRVFQRDTAAASLAAVLEHEVDPDPRIEPRLWVVISRALSKRPYERFATCSEFAEALRDAVDVTDDEFAVALQELRPESVAGAEPDLSRLGALATSPRSRTNARARRGMGWTLAGGLVIAAIAVTVTLAVTRSGTTPARAGEPSSASSALPSSGVVTLATGGASVGVSSRAPQGGSTGTGRDTIPPPSSEPSQVSGVSVVTPTPLVNTTTSAPINPRTSTTTRPTAATTRPTSSGGKPVATSPGF